MKDLKKFIDIVAIDSIDLFKKEKKISALFAHSRTRQNNTLIV